MDWEKQGKQIVHKTGFMLSIDNGTFAMPYELSYTGTDGLSPVEVARMIRSALYHGRHLEQKAQKRRDVAPRHAYGAPQIVTKRRRAYRQ